MQMKPRWLLTALPLLLISISAGWLVALYPNGGQRLMMMGLTAWFLAGSVSATRHGMGARLFTMVAWLPLFLLFPIGTILAFAALRTLMHPPREAVLSAEPPSVVVLSREEIRIRVGEEAELKFQLPFSTQADLWNRDLVQDLRVMPYHLNALLDDLDEHHGLVLRAEDQSRMVTLASLTELLR